jgi:hypothetical protein
MKFARNSKAGSPAIPFIAERIGPARSKSRFARCPGSGSFILLAAKCRATSVLDGSICCIYMVAIWRITSRSISRRTIIWWAKIGLHALGLFFRGHPRSERWEQLGARVMREQMDRQIRADGSSFEQSTYYQGYLLDMFRLHAILARPGPEYCAKLERMAEYLDAVTGPSGCRRCWATTTVDACR